MSEWLMHLWTIIDANSGGIGVAIAAMTALCGAIAWAIRLFSISENRPAPSSGGYGGNARVGGNGTAVGGRGGRGGLSGRGGDGGTANVDGDGTAIGGDGGDAGVPWRPALGAPSVLERMEFNPFPGFDSERDEFGFFIVGRGGHGGDFSAAVVVDGYRYPLLPLTLLLRLWAPATLEAADLKCPANPQAFWDAVIEIDPVTAQAAQEHTRYCLDVAIPKGLSAPDPYSRKKS